MTLPAVADGTATRKANDARQVLVYQLPRIKGVCILAVILIHVTSSYPERTPFDWLTALLIYLNSVGRFAVPIFVALSGFYLSLNARNERPLSFYRRTLKLLIVPYVLYSAGYVTITHPAAAGWTQAWLWATLTGTAFYHLWFIPVIVELYLIHPFLRRWYRRARRGGWAVVLAFIAQFTWGVVAALVIGSPPADSWLSVPIVALSFTSYVGYFVMGYYLLDHASDVVQATRQPALLIAGGLTWAVAAAMNAALLAFPLAYGRALVTIPLRGFAISLLALILSVPAFVILAAWRQGKRVTGPADWLVHANGLYAYGVYYLHVLVFEILAWISIHGAGLGKSDVGFLVTAFPAVCVFSVLLVKLVARLPFARYLV